MSLIHRNIDSGVKRHVIEEGDHRLNVNAVLGVDSSSVNQLVVVHEIASIRFRSDAPDLRLRTLKGSPEITISAIDNEVVGMVALRQNQKVMIGADSFEMKE
ncbi:hypothetical protein HYV64_02470 [Candidatus Shapirobacteria bacterium]|nr:hypothetical protein [Candidatus Shapirobacteria bacterium]